MGLFSDKPSIATIGHIRYLYHYQLSQYIETRRTFQMTSSCIVIPSTMSQYQLKQWLVIFGSYFTNVFGRMFQSLHLSKHWRGYDYDGYKTVFLLIGIPGSANVACENCLIACNSLNINPWPHLINGDQLLFLCCRIHSWAHRQQLFYHALFIDVRRFWWYFLDINNTIITE